MSFMPGVTGTFAGALSRDQVPVLHYVDTYTDIGDANGDVTWSNVAIGDDSKPRIIVAVPWFRRGNATTANINAFQMDGTNMNVGYQPASGVVVNGGFFTRSVAAGSGQTATFFMNGTDVAYNQGFHLYYIEGAATESPSVTDNSNSENGADCAVTMAKPGCVISMFSDATGASTTASIASPLAFDYLQDVAGTNGPYLNGAASANSVSGLITSSLTPDAALAPTTIHMIAGWHN